MPAEAFRAPKGTQDVLAPESRRWEALIARFAATVEGAGYGLVISPNGSFLYATSSTAGKISAFSIGIPRR